MLFIDFIYSLPPLCLRILMTLVATACLVLMTFLLKRYCPTNPNDSATAIGHATTVSTIYAMFIGFVVFSSMANFNSAQTSEANEANIVNATNYAASMLPRPLSTQIHDGLVSYLKADLQEEWPAAQKGQRNTAASIPLQKMMRLIMAYKPTDPNDRDILMRVIQHLEDLQSEHEVRRSALTGSGIGRSIWICLIAATLVMMLSNSFYFFANRTLQLILIFCVGSISGSLIFLEISIDDPYRGFYAVGTTHLQNALVTLQSQTKQSLVMVD